MKKVFVMLVLMLLISGCEQNEVVNQSLEMRLKGHVVEYKYQDEQGWTQLTDLSLLIKEEKTVFDVYLNDVGETILVYGESEINIGIRNHISVNEILFDHTTNQLIATYSDGTNAVIGVIDIPESNRGIDGIGIVSIEINEGGHLIVELTNGTINDLGYIHGNDGLNGKDGLGIIDVMVDELGDCYITYSDFSKVNIGSITGNAGQDGQDGLDGDKGETAYEIYKKYHPTYTKSEREWVDDLVQGKLSSANSYDVLTEEDLITANEDHTVGNIKLQNNIDVEQVIILSQDKSIDLNGYQINGLIHISSLENINILITNGVIVGDVMINLPKGTANIEVEIDGTLKVEDMDSPIRLDYPVSQGVKIYAGGSYQFSKNYAYNLTVHTGDQVDIVGQFDTVLFKEDGYMYLNSASSIDHILVENDYMASIFISYGSTIANMPTIDNLFIQEEVLLTVEGVNDGKLDIKQDGKEVLPYLNNQYILLKNVDFQIQLYKENYFFIQEIRALVKDETYYLSYTKNTEYNQLMMMDESVLVSIEGTAVSRYLDMYLFENSEGIFLVPTNALSPITLGDKYSFQGSVTMIEGLPYIQTIEQQFFITHTSVQGGEDLLMTSLNSYRNHRVNTKGLLIENVLITDTSIEYTLKDIETENVFVFEGIGSDTTFSVGEFLQLTDVLFVINNDGNYFLFHDASLIKPYVLNGEEIDGYFIHLFDEMIPNIVVSNITLPDKTFINAQVFSIEFASLDNTIINTQGEIINSGTVDVTLSFIAGDDSYSFSKSIIVNKETNQIISPILLEDAVYVKGSFVHVEIMLSWNDASEILHIRYLGEDLLLNDEYSIEDGLVIIDANYLQAIDIEYLDICEFNISFDQGSDLLVQVVFE